MQRNPLQIRVSEGFERDLQELADRKGKKLSALCRDLMEAAMEENPGRLREQLVRSLGNTQSLLLRAEDGELVEDVEELVAELAELEEDLGDSSDSEEESEEESK